MSVLTRMLLTYLVIVALIALCGVGIFNYVSRTMEKTLYDNLTASSTRISQQLDSVVSPMEYTTMHLLSNNRFLTAVEDLAGINRVDANNATLISHAKNEIYSQMMSYSLYKYFYRVSVFNYDKDFFSSNYMSTPPKAGYEAAIDSVDWMELAQQKDGRITIIPPYDDPWDATPQKVFAVARAIRGNPTIGFIEVQQPMSLLEDIFNVKKIGSGTTVCAVTKEGSVLYSDDFSPELLKYYKEIISEQSLSLAGEAKSYSNPITGAEEVFAGVKSDYTGVSILLIQDKKLLLAPLHTMGQQVLTLYLVTVVFSCLFFVLQSKNLVAPLRQLKREMEITRLENLPDNGEIKTSNNEITSLNHAFNDLRDRLGELIQRELNLQSLHLQASFDALQAQINPHFLYNTLGLISNRAAMQGDDDACRICGSLASMLRYSVNTKTRMVALHEELEHLQDYIYLMHARFEHRLIVDFNIDSEIENIIIPKMVLQPLVENTINHGFANSEGIMKISVTGRKIEDRWEIEILDNGQGFSDKSLANISEQCDKIDNDPNFLQQSGGELGGLGITNIYARLKLFSQGGLDFYIGNISSGGAKVVIGGNLQKTTKEVTL